MEYYSHAKEQAYLGFILFDDKYLQYDVCQLPAEAFYYESHRKIWQEITRQYAQGIKEGAYPSDQNYISAMHLPNDHTDAAAELLLTWSGLQTAWYANADYRTAWPTTLAQQLRDLLYKRLIHAATQKGLSAMQHKNAIETATEIANGLNHVMLEINKRDAFQQPTPNDLWAGVKYLTSGFASLDNIARGIINPGMTVVGGRVSMGKTSLARALVRTQLFAGRNVFWYSKDMDARQLYELEIANANGLTLDQYTRAARDEAKRQRIIDTAAPVIESWKEHLTITGKNFDIDELCQTITAQHQQKQFDVIVIDHLQLVSAKHARSSYERVTKVSNELKGLALDLGVSVLALAQLGRDAAKNEPPTMEHLKNSGDIEQDSDQIWLLHRPDYYSVRDGGRVRTRENAQVIVAKNKLGEPGTAVLEFTPHLMEFGDPRAPEDVRYR